MLKSTERQIYSYDLEVTKRAEHAAPPSFSKIAQVLGDMHKAGTCTPHEREKGTVVYRVGDVEIDATASVLHILIRRCDLNAANAVYSHVKTGALDIKKKGPDQGGDKAAHLSISLKQETGKPNIYLCHLEGVPGVSHRIVQATVNSLLKIAAKADANLFQYPDPAGARTRGGALKMHSFIPSIELEGHPSDSFKDDLENGVMTGITLVNHSVKQKFGGSPYLVEKEQAVQLIVNKSLPKQNRLGTLLSAFRSKGVNYQAAKIRFKDQEGVSRSIDIDIATGSPEQAMYLQSYTVKGIKPPMDDSTDKLHVFLRGEMSKKIQKERK